MGTDVTELPGTTQEVERVDILSLASAGGVFGLLALVIIYLLRQDSVTRNQMQEFVDRMTAENTTLRAAVDTERQLRMAAEDEAARLRRRYGITEGSS
jgi:hypothetical protein